MTKTFDKVLVTGAGGFIGSHLTEELVSQGYKVKAFIHYNSANSWGWLDYSSKEIKNSIDVFHGDIRDRDSVREASKGCTIIFHLAALISIPYSYKCPESYIETNIKGTLNVLTAALASQAKVIQTSTSEVYGSAQCVPINEKHPLSAQSPYAASKIGADQLALSFFRSYELPVVIVRPFNTYGPRQSLRAVIPSIISQISGHSKVLKLGALSPTRDFSYVTDTAKSFIAASNCPKAIGEVVNLGSGFEISIGETAEIIKKIMGSKIMIETEKNRTRPVKSEVDRLWADSTKAGKILNWEIEYGGLAGFKKGLEKTIRWFTNKNNLNKYKEDPKFI